MSAVVIAPPHGRGEVGGWRTQITQINDLIISHSNHTRLQPGSYCTSVSPECTRVPIRKPQLADCIDDNKPRWRRRYHHLLWTSTPSDASLRAWISVTQSVWGHRRCVEAACCGSHMHTPVTNKAWKRLNHNITPPGGGAFVILIVVMVTSSKHPGGLRLFIFIFNFQTSLVNTCG